jgi:hypothetical protein
MNGELHALNRDASVAIIEGAEQFDGGSAANRAGSRRS